MKVLLKLKYDGTLFSGYQVQNGRRTIQGELNRAALELFGHECNVTGCSRTDAGVHAECFCATVSDRNGSGLRHTVPTDRIPEAMNIHLPSDIAVFSAAEVEDSFHPRYDVKQKTYIYKILNSRLRDPFTEHRVWFTGRNFDESDVKRMGLAAKHFVGKHDFTSFMAVGSKVTDTVRTVTDASVYIEGDILHFSISADGFLYNMVRIMTGTLFDVGKGRRTADDIDAIISAKCRAAAGCTAPACGLYLHDVKY